MICIKSFNILSILYNGHIALNYTDNFVYSPLNSYFIYIQYWTYKHLKYEHGSRLFIDIQFHHIYSIIQCRVVVRILSAPDYLNFRSSPGLGALVSQ